MGKASREKGKRGEREAAGIFKEWGYDTVRGVQYHGGPDSPDVVGLPGIHIEVKRVNQLRLYDALQQSVDDAADDELPIVLHRRDRQPWVVIQPVEDWIMLYEAAQELNRRFGEETESRLRGFLTGMFYKLRGHRMVRRVLARGGNGE